MSEDRAVEVLSPEENKRIHGTVKTFAVLAVMCTLPCIILEIIVFHNGYWKNGSLWVFIVPIAIFAFGYIFVARDYLLFPSDLKANHKIVADTTVLRKKKRGWFDMDARGGLSNSLMGSAYYFYIPDDTRRSGQRRFRVLMDAYNYLQVGQQARVSWLPKSGQILSIDTPDFHWVAWDRRPGDHGHQ